MVGEGPERPSPGRCSPARCVDRSGHAEDEDDHAAHEGKDRLKDEVSAHEADESDREECHPGDEREKYPDSFSKHGDLVSPPSPEGPPGRPSRVDMKSDEGIAGLPAVDGGTGRSK